ncbi:hypothetical protein RUM43_008582, partial [Polyplax serrata]
HNHYHVVTEEAFLFALLHHKDNTKWLKKIVEILKFLKVLCKTRSRGSDQTRHYGVLLSETLSFNLVGFLLNFSFWFSQLDL